MGCLSSKPLGSTGVASSSEQTGGGGDDEWDGTLHSARSWKTSPSVSSEQLQRLRSEFWDSRIEGDSQMWATLRAAADARLSGGEGSALAAELLRAAGLTPANRKRPCLTKFYDETGVLYVVPPYALRDPQNLGEGSVCADFKDAATAVQDLEKDDDNAPVRQRR